MILRRVQRNLLALTCTKVYEFKLAGTELQVLRDSPVCTTGAVLRDYALSAAQRLRKKILEQVSCIDSARYTGKKSTTGQVEPIFYSSGENSSLPAPHSGQTQSSGRSSKEVPGLMPPSGSPFSGS